MMNDIVIRAAINEDSALIRELIFNIWHNEYHFTIKADEVPDLANIEACYPKGSGLFLIAVEDDLVIGTIAASQLSQQQWVLKRMFVAEQNRRKGIAQCLLNQLLDELKLLTRGQIISIYLSTKEDDAISAKAFYLKNNFVSIDKSELPHKFPYFHKDDLFMKRALF